MSLKSFPTADFHSHGQALQQQALDALADRAHHPRGAPGQCEPDLHQPGKANIKGYIIVFTLKGFINFIHFT